MTIMYHDPWFFIHDRSHPHHTSVWNELETQASASVVPLPNALIKFGTHRKHVGGMSKPKPSSNSPVREARAKKSTKTYGKQKDKNMTTRTCVKQNSFLYNKKTPARVLYLNVSLQISLSQRTMKQKPKLDVSHYISKSLSPPRSFGKRWLCLARNFQ